MRLLQKIQIAVASLAVMHALPSFAQTTPVFDFQNIMDMYFDDTSGLISFGDYTVAFAPENEFSGLVAILDSAGQIVSQHAFFPEYTNRAGVFARVRAVGPADTQLTEPGLYTIVFVVNGQPVNRFLVRLVQTSSGDDPFDPEKTFAFDGYWRTLAHFTTSSFANEPIPVLTIWMGGPDLIAQQRDSFNVSLFRDDQLVAHSKRDLTTIQPGHFRRTSVNLFHPHTEKEAPNANYFTMEDLQIDGTYQVRVQRSSDDVLLRTYDFEVAGGAVQGLARSSLDYEPKTDYIMPRVLKTGTTGLEMTEAIWIQRGQ